MGCRHMRQPLYRTLRAKLPVISGFFSVTRLCAQAAKDFTIRYDKFVTHTQMGIPRRADPPHEVYAAQFGR